MHEPAPANIVLMGLRGSGKSTAGRLAADRLGRAFIDLDDVTARLMGFRAVAAAWAARGQAAFRAAEVESLREVLGARGRVIALGGGTPTAPGAADLLRAAQGAGSVVVVYLHAPPAVLRARLEQDDPAARPSITGQNALAEIDRVYAERDPLYRSLADHIVETGGLMIEEVVGRVVEVALT